MDRKQTSLNDPNFVFTPSLFPTVGWNSLLPLPINQISESPYSIASTSQSVVAYEDIKEKMQSSSRITRANVLPRFECRTRSETEKLDDGYRWRKYGQKSVKDSIYPRSYFRCTCLTCSVKKQVQRLAKDDTIVITTYEGTHNHRWEKLIETLTPLLNQMEFLSNFN